MLTIPAPCDMHIHFRQDETLAKVVKHTDRVFEYALAMPNTDPPICNYDDLCEYEKEIKSHCKRMKPLLAVMLTPDTTPEQLAEASKIAVAAKLYPARSTNNSENGFAISQLSSKKFLSLLDVLCDTGMMLCVHGESPDEFCMDRERIFLYQVQEWIKQKPKLKIVLEHLTCWNSVEFVTHYHKQLCATITLHHLILTLDDIIGTTLNPYHFCKPIPKRSEDRNALLKVATTGHPNFFFGSDSAPHSMGNKLYKGAPGIFSAPIALEGVAHIFKRENKLSNLKTFISENARNHYKLPAPSYNVDLNLKEWVVPAQIDDFSVFLGGKTLDYFTAA